MDILIFALVILVASYFQGITGFGQGLIAAPVAFVLFDKRTALTILIVAGIILNWYLVATIKARLHLKTLYILLAGGALGLPIGLIVARSVSLSTLQLAVGSVSVASVLALLFYKVRLHRRPAYSLAAGFASGILQTSTALSGPPVILLLAEENTAKQTMRKLLPAYFLIMGLVAAILFIPAGLLGSRGIIIGLIAAPLVIYGGYVGNDETRKIHQKFYRLLVMCSVLATGLLAVYEGFQHLLTH